MATTQSKSIPRTNGEGDAHSTKLIMLTSAATIVALALGRWWIVHILVCIPAWLHVARLAPPREENDLRTMVLRWGVAVFLVTLTASAFIPERAVSSVFHGDEIARTTELWLSGQGSHPWGIWAMVVLPLAFAAITGASGGLLGWLMLSVLLGNAAIVAATLFAHGHNIVQVAVIALAPWQWAFFAGAWLLFEPLSALSARRVLPDSRLRFDWTSNRRTIYIGAGFMILALLLHLTTSGAYSALVSRWTTA